MECADSRHVTLCDADSRGFIVVAFCSAILHHWMCKIPTEVATLTKSIRINFMGGLRGKQFIAPMVVEGYCNNNVCQAYIDQCLIPCLSPGETVIMDNASFHKSKGVKEAIEDAGCHLLFLPPYSPDLNPIEHVWSPLKNRVRMKLDQDEINLEAALSQVMKSMSETVRWGLLQKIRISFRKVVYLHSLLQIKQLIQITY
ncbi:hypothetical protein PsalBI1_04355 (plasmid) [Piscirickettsia salmonis]|nr:hypothetical protein PsalBI1_04355 [Piscirickettsia salmonis]